MNLLFKKTVLISEHTCKMVAQACISFNDISLGSRLSALKVLFNSQNSTMRYNVD